MKFVNAQVTMNITRRSTIGFGSAPRSPTILSAISSPAPVVSRALASVRDPPKRNTTFRSMEASASFSERTPNSTRMIAPMHAEISMLTPICFSKIIARITSIRTISETVCFHFGTSLKSFCFSTVAPTAPFPSGRNLYPMKTK